MEPSALEKFDYIRRLHAGCDLIIGGIDTGSKTPMELAGYLPAMVEQLPPYHAQVLSQIQPDLIEAALKEKNRNAIRAHVLAVKQYLVNLTDAIDQEKPIISHFPSMTPEIFLSMDLAPLSSELFSLFLSALFTDGVEAEIDEKEAEGFPGHVCAFQKSCFGAIEKGLLPVPNIFVKTTAPCDSSNMLYQYLQDRYKMPVLSVDSPYYYNPRAFKYFVDEYKRMIEEVEKITGHTIDEDRLRSTVTLGNQQLEYLYGLQALRRQIPNPDPGMHRALDTASLFLAGTSEKVVDYMKICYDEAKARHDQKLSFLPEGKKEIRTIWTYGFTGHAIYLADWLEETFGSSYLECGLSIYPAEIVGLVNTSSVESMIEGLAWRSFNSPMHRTVMTYTDLHVNDIVTTAKAYRADAAIFGGNHSCKYAWTLPKLLSDALLEELGIPSFSWETDLIDKRFAPPSAVKIQLTEFFQTVM
ncbi:MAG: 2-hydroxyacyl-CoA dehydratase family protein [Desulfobacterales bacterium]|jgi:benzoyl-CoA reductase/2-hydroxyglutaryl-CoA dehydratase subunit BcrC/BadD/HgdB|nr:2-hydroxyacyl-CoA dehydratase family protein [Desulfobacterales bacterium]